MLHRRTTDPARRARSVARRAAEGVRPVTGYENIGALQLQVWHQVFAQAEREFLEQAAELAVQLQCHEKGE